MRWVQTFAQPIPHQRSAVPTRTPPVRSLRVPAADCEPHPPALRITGPGGVLLLSPPALRRMEPETKPVEPSPRRLHRLGAFFGAEPALAGGR